MADYHMQFSECINRLNASELHWWKLRVEKLQSDLENDADVDYPGEIVVDEGNRQVHLYSESGGDPFATVKIVQEFLKFYRSKGHFSLTWAFTCDKPRIGEFGGGALFVTADSIDEFDVTTWLRDRIREFQKRIKK